MGSGPVRGQLYWPLSPRSIRLLRLTEGKLHADVGILEEVELDTAPPFYALSHSWGTQKQNAPLQIQGETFWVGADLATGIRRCQELSGKDSALSPSIEYIWIDIICINQGDVAERSSQVSLIGDIYSRSMRTLIWLGPAFDSSSLAWELIDTIYGLFQIQHLMLTSPGDIPAKMYSDSSHAITGLPGWADERWRFLNQLFKRHWFSRIWVVQEVVLSRQDPILLHGEHLFPWYRLEWAALWMQRNGYVRLHQIPDEVTNVDAISSLRRSQAKWPLNALLSITHIKFHATNQRDKIYGLLGLAAESHHPSGLPDALVPDYTIGIGQLYQKVALYFLEHNGSLSILTRTHGTSGSLTRRHRQYDFKDFPSWLPDWSDFTVYNRDLRRSFSWIHYSDISKPARLGFPNHYVAAGNLQLKLHVTEDPSILRVSGMKVDTVIQVLRMNDEDVMNSQFNLSFSSTMAQVCAAALPLLEGRELEAWASHFIKATTAEQYGLSGREWDQCLKDGLAYLRQLLLDSEDLMSLFTPRSEKSSTRRLEQLSEGGEPRDYAALARNFCYNRSFVITSVGGMGIGPSDSQVGDTVAVIPGGGVPYIIRQYGTGWIFVGEAYVHGVMNGEAVEECLRGSIQEEILEFQ